jgi:putative FmdB family regulatory protein
LNSGALPGYPRGTEENTVPIYEYDCPECGKHFEVLVRTKNDIPGKCTVCGKGKPVKAFSAFAVTAAGRDTSSVCEACPSETAARCPSAGACATGGCPYTG